MSHVMYVCVCKFFKSSIGKYFVLPVVIEIIKEKFSINNNSMCPKHNKYQNFSNKNKQWM